MALKTDDNVYSEYQRCKSHRQNTWDGIAEKAAQYYHGDQWSAEEKAYLKSKNRAPITHNLILPAVDLIVGHFLVNRQSLVAKPVDEYGDEQIAEIITAAVKQIEHSNRMSDQEKRQFTSGIHTGIGVLEIDYDNDKDPRGSVRCGYAPAPDFYLDPDGRQYDLTDHSVLFREVWLSADDIEEIYGKEAADTVQAAMSDKSMEVGQEIVQGSWAGTSNDYGNLRPHQQASYVDKMAHAGFDTKYRLFRVVEQYDRRYHDVYLLFDPISGEMVEMGEDDDFPKDEAIKEREKYIHLKSIIGDNTVVEDDETYATEFTELFNFFFPYWFDGKFMGVIENLLSPQDEVNHRHSATVHALSAIAHIGFIYEESAFPDEETEAGLKRKLAEQGFIIKAADGAVGERKIHEFTQHDVPQTLLKLMDRDAFDIKNISGASEAMQGINQRQMSGRAKEHDIVQGSVRLMPILDNFKESKLLCRKAFFSLMQKFYTDERVIRIMGEPMGNETEFVMNKQAYGEVFNDITVGEYDFVWEFENTTKTERQRNQWFLSEMQRSLPPEFAIILAKEQLRIGDLPISRQVLQEFEQEQQRQAQIQAMQMQGQQGGAPAYNPRPSRGVRRMPERVAG